MATARRDDVPLASARSGQRERVFMITGIGVHDRTDRPFKITGMRRLLKVQILLKADVSEAGEGWSDSKIMKAFDTTDTIVYTVRKKLVGWWQGFAPNPHTWAASLV